MALITDAATGWSAAVTLTSDEIWQTRKGSGFITTTAAPAAGDDIALHEYHAIQLTAGSEVRYRKDNPGDAVIVREAL